MLTSVASLATIKPLPLRPINAIKIPIPAVTACFILSGIELTTASRTLNSVKNINIIPSTNTAESAISQETPPFNTTVYAKNAFSPIPEARANGRLAIKPIKKQPRAAAIHVPVTRAPASIPVAASVLGLTAMI